MSEYVILLSVPGLRRQDLAHMPRLAALTAGGDQAELAPTFPAVTCTVQASMTTGAPPSEHGVIANGFYWRDRKAVEMWTTPNECVDRPQIWDTLREQAPGAGETNPARRARDEGAAPAELRSRHAPFLSESYSGRRG